MVICRAIAATDYHPPSVRHFAPAIKRLKLTQGYDAFGVSPFATYPQRR